MNQNHHESVNWVSFVNWVFLGLISFMAWKLVTVIQELTDGQGELNKNMVLVLSKVSDHEKKFDKADQRFDRQDERIQYLFQAVRPLGK